MKQQITQKTQPFLTAITTHSVGALPVLLFGRKKKEPPPNQTAPQDAQDASKQKRHKPTGTKVAKCEIAEDKLKFFDTKGLFKKHWVIVKEFPIAEVSEPECLENWLGFKWNGASYVFVLKRKKDSFVKVYEQLQSALDEQRKIRQQKEKAALRKAEILAALNAVLPAVDASFDVLLGLHKKRVDWSQIEECTKTWATPLSFRAQSLPSLDIDYSKAAEAIKAQVAKETTKETLSILKVVHSYFMGLKPEDDMAEATPNFEHAKAILLSYYTLNDLILAKVVGEKDSKKEADYLEENLKLLSDETAFKVDASALMASIDVAAVKVDADEARRLFLGQLSQL